MNESAASRHVCDISCTYGCPAPADEAPEVTRRKALEFWGLVLFWFGSAGIILLGLILKDLYS